MLDSDHQRQLLIDNQARIIFYSLLDETAAIEADYEKVDVD